MQPKINVTTMTGATIVRKMLYIYPTAFEDVRTSFIVRFWQALQCWRFGDTGAALFHWTLAWDRLLNRGYYAPGGAIDAMFPNWRNSDLSELDHTSKP